MSIATACALSFLGENGNVRVFCDMGCVTVFVSTLVRNPRPGMGSSTYFQVPVCTRLSASSSIHPSRRFSSGVTRLDGAGVKLTETETDGVMLVDTDGLAVRDGVAGAVIGDNVAVTDAEAVNETETEAVVDGEVVNRGSVITGIGHAEAVGVDVNVGGGGDGSVLDSLGETEGVGDGIGGQSQQILTLRTRLKMPLSRRHEIVNGTNGNVLQGIGFPIMSPVRKKGVLKSRFTRTPSTKNVACCVVSNPTH